MSGVTDSLIKLAKDITPLPSEREMDMLLATGEQQTIALTAIALHALGIPAVSLTGAQAGIVTDVRSHQGENPQHHAEKSPRALERRATSSSSPVFRAKRPKARSRRSAAAVRI